MVLEAVPPTSVSRGRELLTALAVAEAAGSLVASQWDLRTVSSDKRTLSALQATRPIAEALRRTSCRRGRLGVRTMIATA